MPPISGAWAKALEGEFHKPYYKKLFETVGKEYATHQIFPAGRIRTTETDRLTGFVFR